MTLRSLVTVYRKLRSEPGFTFFATLTLALGIGASTAMFSVAYRVLLSGIPYADPQRVVAVSTRFTNTGRQNPRVTGPDWADIANAGIFESTARYHGGEEGIQVHDHAAFATTYLVSPSFFSVFGAKPLRGRYPGEADANRTGLISSSFAARAFGDAVTAIGQTVRLDSQSYEIIGVMPPGFAFPAKAEVWLTTQTSPENHSRTAYNYRAVAKLAVGVTLAQAQSRLQALGAQLTAAHPEENQNKSFDAIPLQEALSGGVRATILLLSGAVLLVLLITCTNVANLLLARAAARQRECALRLALGASRSRLFADSLVESLALGSLGCAAGMLFAYLGVRLLVWIAPANLPRLNEIQVDWTVLALGAGVSLISTLLFGIMPAWQATRVDLNEGLRQAGSRGVVSGGGGLRNILVVAEIALSFALAIASGLLFRSFVELNNVPLGYRPDGLLIAYAHSPANTMPAMLASTRFFEKLLPELQRLPGAVASAAAMGLPSGSYGSHGLYFIEGGDVTLAKAPNAGFRLASAGYFITMGVPLLQGRDFNEHDQYDRPFVAIVSESLAKRSFPGQNPLGHRLQCGLDSPTWMTIVGVVGDVRSDSPASAPGPELYMPFQQHPVYANELQLVVRTAVAPESLQAAVERLIHQRNPLVATKFTTMQNALADSVATPRFRTSLVSAFAGIALVLAMSGVFGLISYFVTRRMVEMGVRMALGASPAGIVRLVLARAAVLAALGLAAGAALAVAGARLLTTMLFGLTPTDPQTYIAAAIALGVVTMLAAALPAIRASRIDPAIALRAE